MRLKFLLGLTLLFSIATNTHAASTDAAQSLLHRLIGDRASSFQLELIPSQPNSPDTYELSAAGGIVTIRGSSTIALTHGAYDYLRDACHCIVTWTGNRLDLPAQFPDLPLRRVTSPFRWRQQYNVCTFGYTTPYWSWPDWEHELDWLALHGFNMALAPVATEAIWNRVWLDMGLTQSEIDAATVGPAHLPWMRMGNIVKWDGPLPHSWNDQQLALQKKIITRMRELGIEPIAPAFAGFVPPALQRLHPELKLQRLSWGGFAPQYGASVLDATSDLFPIIGGKFIHAWEKEFGPATYFLADTFNEMKVPVPNDRAQRLATLTRYGQAVYHSISGAQPNATWVMQGWLFSYDQKFWDTDSVKALLAKVPDDHMIILDLAVDRKAVWKMQDAFYGKQWFYSLLHNMGGKSTLGGDLHFFATDPAAALASPNHGHLTGFGLAPEGIENNDAVYELLSDVSWSANPIDLDSWTRAYCLSRYGSYPDDLHQAWDLFRKTCYAIHVDRTRPAYQQRPMLHPKPADRPDDSPEFHQAVKLFLSAADHLQPNDLYRADAIEFTGQYLGNRIDRALHAAISAHLAHDPAARDHFSAAALDLMDDLDALMAAHPLHRLDRWVNKARALGQTPAEQDYYEHNAKLLITLWGGHFTDYASKSWAGLIRGYYHPRWQTFFADLAKGADPDVKPMETRWVNTPGLTPPVRQVTDVVSECRRLLAKGEQLQSDIDAAKR
ncbi:MAG TPA: alpha-N-acetylglucosaminidase [Tepidisphaeraceae bacterium]|jgi:alpha-N-acetylglucosaminidase|nr:alpha-N-acetylglucosaminidase [Tepidisphaeraceae bacterium]